MNILVAHASRHGATAGIAERIAETLSASGHTATSAPVGEVMTLDDYDAVVLGAAVYIGHWLKPATKFAHRHAGELAGKPVWLFGSGPLGTEPVDSQGVDAREATRPKEFDEVTALLKPRGERVFFGAFDSSTKSAALSESLVRHLPAGRQMLHEGDFRDWDAIDAWAHEIAESLDPASS